MENILINLYCGHKKKSHVLNLYCIFSLSLVLLFTWMWVMITTSSPSVATDNWVGRECNSKQKVGNFKRCHRHHPWHIFLWPQYSSGRLNNIDSCTQLQPNNIFQVRTLKALNTAVFCHIECTNISQEPAASIIPDHTLWLHDFYQTPWCYILEDSSAHCQSCDLVHENTD